MSLKVWLPLIGTLENKGTGNLTVVSGTPAYKTSGKIGASALNLNTRITFDCPQLANLQTFSVAFWGIAQNSSTLTTNWQDLLGFTDVSSGGTNGTFRWETTYSSSNGIHWHDNSTNALVNGAHNHITVKEQWVHCCVVFDFQAGKLYSYDNGILTETHNHAGGHFNANGRFYLGETNNIEGMIQDVRFYDHALSAAEVHEISQGLVLHYKLDSLYNESSQNLCTVVRPGTASNSTWGGHVTQWTNYDATNDPVPFNDGTKGEVVYGSNDSTGGGASRSICTIAATPSTTYTYSCYIKASDDLVYTHANFLYKYEYTAVSGGTKITEGGYFNSSRKESLNNGWYRIWGTFTTRDNTNCINLSFFTYPNKNVTYWLGGWQIEQKDHVTPFIVPGESRNDTTIYDSSGYGNNAASNGSASIIMDSDTPKYNYSTKFSSGARIATPIATSIFMPKEKITVSIWYKSSAATARFLSCTEGGGFNFEVNSSKISFPFYVKGKGYGRVNATENFSSDNQWHMLTATYDGTTAKIYLNGILNNSETITSGWENIELAYNANTPFTLGAEAQTITSPIAGTYVGNLSDCRIYCTALSADDILQLYNIGAKIDNLGNIHTFELKEESSNILFLPEVSRTKLEFTNGLSRYTQANCQVTLTENGFRIYRPPNLTTANDGNTMYGGLKLVNQSTDTVNPYDAIRDNIWKLQKGHTYLLAFHAKGKTTNAVANFSFTNNMGWGVGGVSPSPTVIATSSLTANFNGEKDCFYIFTINDDIIKTSNDARAGYDGSSQYLSYRHIAFNWGYANTGTDGTDIYLTNFRMYDITNAIGKIKNIGQIDFNGFIEQLDKAQIRKRCELLSSEFIEL